MKLLKRPEIDAFLKSPPKNIRACVIHGRDRAQVIERTDLLAKALVPDTRDPFNVALLTDGDLESDPARLEDELSALSLMGGRRLIRLSLFSEKAPLEKRAAEALSAHLGGGFNPEAVFVIETPALGADSKLRKLAEADKCAFAIACYEDETGDVVRMVREALTHDGVGLSSEAMTRFVARMPKERGIARQEIERLILYIGPGSHADDLDEFLGVEPEASLFQAALDAFGGRLAAAQACLRRAQAEGEGGPMMVRALSGHFAKLKALSAALSGGMGAKEASKAAGIFWKQEAEMLRQVKGWRDEVLGPIAIELIDTDRLTKTTGMPDALIAERLYLSIASRAKRLGL